MMADSGTLGPARTGGLGSVQRFPGIWVAVAVALASFGSPPEQAQGTTYLSNTSETVNNGIAVASNQWIAAQFVTGTNSAGYSLDSIDYLSDGVLNTPSGFGLYIYSDAGGFPGSSIGGLTGSSDPSGVIVTYSYIAPNTPLNASTPYWVVATQAEPTPDGYFWAVTFSTNYFSTDGWDMPIGTASSPDGGLNWNAIGVGGRFQFAVNATPVPEPQTWAVACLALIGLLWRSRRKS